jgi:hypothetical protein
LVAQTRSIAAGTLFDAALSYYRAAAWTGVVAGIRDFGDLAASRTVRTLAVTVVASAGAILAGAAAAAGTSRRSLLIGTPCDGRRTQRCNRQQAQDKA